MNAEIIFYIILSLFVFEFLLSKILDYLNTLKWSDKLPEELEEIYDDVKYKKSMRYERAKHDFWNLSWIFTFILMYFVLTFWLFWHLDNFIRQYSENQIILALMFFWIIMLIQTIISLPFSFYSNFVIEHKFWFNKMSKKTFFLDNLKSFLLTIVIWWLLLSFIVWIYTLSWKYFWLYTWIVITIFSVFMMMFYSTLIVPIFNKQKPLEEWELRDEIEHFAKKVWFKLNNIFVIDWSKRSSKANAYFSWFWPKKRIVLYDTLIKDLEIEELVWVLAHEIWHYKKKHTLIMLAFSIIQTWFMLYIFWLTLNIEEVSLALWAKQSSFWISLVAFWILFTPISIILWLFDNILSRKHEYQADKYAWKHYYPKQLKHALIKLSRNNLSNLRPHPAYEFFYYSHPTVLKRLKALDKIK